MHKTNLLAIQLLFPIHKKDLLTWEVNNIQFISVFKSNANKNYSS